MTAGLREFGSFVTPRPASFRAATAGGRAPAAMWSVLVWVAIMCPAVAAAQTVTNSGDSAFDAACVNAAAVLISSTEATYPADIARWISLCDNHPRKASCESMSEIIRGVRKATPLNCTGGVPAAGDKTISADRARQALDRFERETRAAR